MLDWIAANLATILICALLIVIVFLIVRYTICIAIARNDFG